MRALVLLSGGLDSTVALFWALQHYSAVDAITFDYGQRARAAERRASTRIWDVAGKSGYSNLGYHDIVYLSPGTFVSASSILGAVPVTQYETAEEASWHTADDPAYVPLRNAVFAVIAAHHLLGGHGADGGDVVMGIRGKLGASYPDDTSAFADKMTAALIVGSSREVRIRDPLNDRDDPSRADTIMMGTDFRGCMEALSYSISCFEAPRAFEAGRSAPCGKCLPCLRREQAFNTVGIPDPAKRVQE